MSKLFTFGYLTHEYCYKLQHAFAKLSFPNLSQENNIKPSRSGPTLQMFETLNQGNFLRSEPEVRRALLHSTTIKTFNFMY